MQQYNIGEWVDLEENPTHKTLREAIHTVLIAISTGKWPNHNMIIKGGVLLAIRYESIRFTEDIDFSTNINLKDFDQDSFLLELEQNLASAVEKLDYGLDCKIQSYQLQPSNNPNATFPTFKIKIGYAYKHDTNAHKRLLKKQSLHIVKLDYSLNEETYDVEPLILTDGGTIYAYSIYDIIAEKFRAILQQKTRNRVRRQDSYDLYTLINNFPITTDEERKVILDTLLKKSASRNLEISIASISDPETIQRSEEQYHVLASEIDGELPEFETVYRFVKNFYESLPWGK
ncbi:MAG: nucleotidyl transferase AbiEii/AbiGii toxin family protein [Actinobacteria bacterium]|jgi:predicted nucleotidyltransferase component of viral defense system|nr:nucleotidyl transferase AbiEii/AbiGii toxin family protein [Actinomycetota bacterium]MBU4401066.1 nucleotidyl transferase AbiEii/AbiGii toxin family protein [Planctomycetota bacterium]